MRFQNLVVVLLLLVFAQCSFSQEPIMDRLARMENNNAVMGNRLTRVEMKIDSLVNKIDNLAVPAARPATRVVVQSGSCANGSCGSGMAQVMTMGSGSRSMSMGMASMGGGKHKSRMKMRMKMGRRGGC